jgi:hypothetical protein
MTVRQIWGAQEFELQMRTKFVEYFQNSFCHFLFVVLPKEHSSFF